MPESVAVPDDLRAAIVAWFRSNGRPLAFRRTRDPYAILVSEAMAQQTQAARAAEAWERFMVRFPTVSDLAAASPADVVRAWQGLGYDRRALNLWRAAQVIVERHGEHVPADLTALEALPGVGPYTARAVLALAFGVPVGAVDTNVRRVLGRIAGGGPRTSTPAAMQVLADEAVPEREPGAWTHALMDLGATVCRARQPRCPECPARPWCRSAGLDTPVRVSPRRRSTGQRAPTTPFSGTNRWLRGRILDRLRAAPGTTWVELDDRIGIHGRPAVTAALGALERDGMIEFEPPGRARLRGA